MTDHAKLQQLFEAALRAPEEEVITLTRVVPNHWSAPPPRPEPATPAETVPAVHGGALVR